MFLYYFLTEQTIGLPVREANQRFTQQSQFKSRRQLLSVHGLFFNAK